MSTTEAIRNIDREVAADLERKMAEAFPPKVVAMKQQPKVERYVAPDPESDRDRLESSSRKAITIRKQQIADTKKGLKATLASLAAARKDAKARYDRLMADLSEREAEAKERAAQDIAAAQKIVSACEASLEILTAE